MRYVAAFLYALAIGTHTAGFVDVLMTAGCVFVGTVALVVAIEHVIIRARREAASAYPLETVRATARRPIRTGDVVTPDDIDPIHKKGSQNG